MAINPKINEAVRQDFWRMADQLWINELWKPFLGLTRPRLKPGEAIVDYFDMEPVPWWELSGVPGDGDQMVILSGILKEKPRPKPGQ